MRKSKCKIFILFSNCIPVKGAKRSIICDLQMGRYRFIPNLLYEILTTHRNLPIDNIKINYNFAYDKGIDAYFQLLIDDEWGFDTNDPEVFPQMDLKWDFPGLISNAIIDIDANSSHNYQNIFNQLDSLGCAALQIRFFYDIELLNLEEILATTINGNLSYIEIYLQYKKNLNITEIKSFLSKHPRIRLIYFYGADRNKLIDWDNSFGQIFFTMESISFSSHCGYVNKEYFRSNLSLFTEGQKFNTCLNRKVAIDRNGQIKNCPYTTETYEDVSINRISDVIKTARFRKYWEINKDQIEICKDCEFRYICTDCRVFLKDNNNLFSKPFHCSYDPYTATWES